MEYNKVCSKFSPCLDFFNCFIVFYLDGRISKNQEEKSLADVELLPRDGKDDIHKVVIKEEGDFKIHGISPLSRQICQNEGKAY